MTSWVLGGRDPTEVKDAVQTRLENEETQLKFLEDKLAASVHLTSGMTSILTSFDSRLLKLEKTILPVYQETENLQRRQENIDRTLNAMDHVISFYNVSKEVEAVVREGPKPPPQPATPSGFNVTGHEERSLQNYLQTMSRLKGALDYFEKNNPQSIELENVKSLYEIGGDALSREFSDVIKKYSRPIPPQDVLNSISLDEELGSRTSSHSGSNSNTFGSIPHFPEDVQTNLIAVAEWLNLNDHDEYMNIYASVRSQVMKKSLDQLRDYQRSASGGSSRKMSPGMSRKFSSPNVESLSGTPTGKRVSRISSSLNRKFSNLSNKLEGATGLNVGVGGRKSLMGNTPTIPEDSVGEFEVESFCLSVSALQRLMTSEQTLMVGIIPAQFQKKIFELVTKDSLESVLRDGDAIVSRVKKSVSNSDFLAILSVFVVIRHLSGIKPLMDRTLEGCEPSVRSRYNGLINQFFNTGSSGLDSFVDGIRSDSTTKEKMPKDGTVFQLTSNVLLFLEQLLDYVETLAAILQQDTSYNQTLLRLPRKISVSDRNHALVGLYIRKVLIQLNLTLVNKSETYADPYLKAVFRLNNNQYILRSLQKTGLLDVVQLAEADCEENYNDMILEQKRLYSQSWMKIIEIIWSSDEIPSAILQAPGRLGDKHCRAIKEKFAGFNKEMEDIYLAQRSYSVPDVELRESLKRDNKEYILPKYSAFYDKYANVAFTKNPEKYVKYTPAKVSAHIDSFFDAAA